MPAATDPLVPTAEDAAPRIVLFGHPASGKSSLLGALLQASDTQPEILEAEIVAPGQRLVQLREALYGTGRLDPVRTTIVTHRLHVQPLPTEGEPLPAAYPVVVVDCDGAAANAILKHPDNPLTDLGVRTGSLAQVIVQADVLVLVLSADDTEAEHSQSFNDFQLFLERLHGHKTFAREVGGFPIMLVLTQCDLLVEPGDTRDRWEERLAVRVGELTQRLTEDLNVETHSDERPSPYFRFGSVTVTGYATAIHRPPLADDPTVREEPYGVAELFRDCFAAAQIRRTHVTTSNRQLSWTVRSVLATLAAMILGLLLIMAFQPPAAQTLADRIRDYQTRLEPVPEVRLAAKNINHTELLLNNFHSDPAFPELPVDLRRFVEQRQEEVHEYRKLRAALNDPQLLVPAEVLTIAQRKMVQDRLDAVRIPPEWQRTEAALQREKWLDDLRLIDQIVSAWYEWYTLQAGVADSLMRTKSFDAQWLTEIDRLVARTEHPAVADLVPRSTIRTPIALNQPVPGAQPALSPRDRVITFGVAYRFEKVALGRDLWLPARNKLFDLRSLADALALTPLDASRPLHGVLAIPADATTPPSERLHRLRKSLGSDFNPVMRWWVDRFDEPSRGVLLSRLDESRAHVNRAMRSEIQARFGPLSAPGKPEAQRWRELGTVIEGDLRIRAWGELLYLLDRLNEPTAPDSLAQLIDFLKREQFELTLTGFELRVPNGYQPRGKPVAPIGELQVAIGNPGAATTLRFKPVGPTNTGVWATYHFVPDGNARMNYRPGEPLHVTLGVNLGDGSRAEFAWTENGPSAFPFERLRTPSEPKLTQPGTEPRTAPGVKLIPLSGSSVPTLPSLLPLP